MKADRALPDRSHVHAASRQQGRRPDRHVDDGDQAAATNWPGGSYDPETHTLYVASQTVRRHAGPRAAAARRGPGRARITRAPCCLEHADRWLGRRGRTTTLRRGRQRRAARRRRRWRQSAVSAGSADHQAAVRPHQRHRSGQRRHPLAGRRTARRPTRSGIIRRSRG